MASKVELPEALTWTWPRPHPGGDPITPWLLAVGSEDDRTAVLSVQLELQKSVLEAQLKAVAQMQDLVARR